MSPAARRRVALVATVAAAMTPAVTVVALSGPADASAVTCGGRPATIVGTPGSDSIIGTEGPDVIAGLGGNDHIRARGGDDVVCGGAGADRIDGGTGDDRLHGGRDLLHGVQEDGTERDGDTLRGGAGRDHLFAGVDRRRADVVVPDVYSWSGAARGVHVDLRTRTARGQGADSFADGPATVEGSAHADVFEGSSHRDRIRTGRGADVVRARGGDDVVEVGLRPHAGRAEARVHGGSGDDRLTATERHARLWGGPGDDWVEDGAQGARLRGGPGHDVVLGGDNLVSGGRGDDALTGLIGDHATFSGGPGVDYLQVNSTLEGHHPVESTGTWDLGTGDLAFTVDATTRLSASGIERTSLPGWGTSWTVTGTGRDEYVGGDFDSTWGVTFRGRGGDDSFRGTDGDDAFYGGKGDDHALGMGAGDDTCVSVESIDGGDCEHIG